MRISSSLFQEMTKELSSIDNEMLALWEQMKPREAASLKFIAMDETATFAGQFTAICDSHGDRYFLITQAPRSGKWTMASNLTAILDANKETLPKTAIESIDRYQAVVSKAIYRLDAGQAQGDEPATNPGEAVNASLAEAKDELPQNGQEEASEAINFTLEIESGIDTGTGLIYMWEIRSRDSDELLGRYIGKSSKGEKRPLTHYRRNVANLLAGKPYRKDNPNGYRRIHHALANASREDHRVVLRFLTNVSNSEDINELERRLIREFNCSGSESWQLND